MSLVHWIARIIVNKSLYYKKCLYLVDLATFQILGQKFVNLFIGILVQATTPKGHFEINWPSRILLWLQLRRTQTRRRLDNYNHDQNLKHSLCSPLLLIICRPEVSIQEMALQQKRKNIFIIVGIFEAYSREH